MRKTVEFEQKTLKIWTGSTWKTWEVKTKNNFLANAQCLEADNNNQQGKFLSNIQKSCSEKYLIPVKMSSQVRQNFHEDCEAAINRQINMELYASYTYLSMVREVSIEWRNFKLFSNKKSF